MQYCSTLFFMFRWYTSVSPFNSTRRYRDVLFIDISIDSPLSFFWSVPTSKLNYKISLLLPPNYHVHIHPDKIHHSDCHEGQLFHRFIQILSTTTWYENQARPIHWVKLRRRGNGLRFEIDRLNVKKRKKKKTRRAADRTALSGGVWNGDESRLLYFYYSLGWNRRASRSVPIPVPASPHLVPL